MRAAVKLTPLQERHGYVETCVDEVVSRLLALGRIRIDIAGDVAQWNVRYKNTVGDPPSLAVKIAKRLAGMAIRAGRPDLAIPADRVGGDLYYALMKRSSPLTEINGHQRYKRRSNWSAAAEQAKADIAAANAKSLSVHCNSIRKSDASIGCNLSADQARKLAGLLRAKAKLISEGRLEGIAIQIANRGASSTKLVVELTNERRPRRGK